MYIDIYIYIYIYIRAYICIYIHIFTCTCLHSCRHMKICTQTKHIVLWMTIHPANTIYVNNTQYHSWPISSSLIAVTSRCSKVLSPSLHLSVGIHELLRAITASAFLCASHICTIVLSSLCASRVCSYVVASSVIPSSSATARANVDAMELAYSHRPAHWFRRVWYRVYYKAATKRGKG